MNKWLPSNRKWVLRYEAINAQLYIRDFVMNHTVKEIYENIGQVLSFARMQLSEVNLVNKKDKDHSLDYAGSMVGQAIRELRVMCTSFYPDANLLKEEGFNEALKNAVKILFKNSKPFINSTGVAGNMQPEVKLITFKMILEILSAISDVKGELLGVALTYTKEKVKCTVNFHGTISILQDVFSSSSELDITLRERAELIDGQLNLSQTKAGVNQVKLISPLKISFYG